MDLTSCKFVIFLSIINFVYCNVNGTTEKFNNNLSNNYKVLVNDMQWLFERLYNLADTVEQILPSAVGFEEGRTVSESKRINLLQGIRHVITGVKKIASIGLERFRTNRTYEQKGLVLLVADVIGIAKYWLSVLRIFVADFVRFYSYFMPELLLGKCIGRYMVTSYPNKLFYEYPFLLFNEIFQATMHYLSNNTEISTEISHTPTITENEIDDDNITQNEILSTELGPIEALLLTNKSFPKEITDANVTSAEHNKVAADKTVERSWQACLQTFTIEFVLRRLRVFFLEEEQTFK